MGNLDLHAKNISLLQRTDDSMTLTPAYDVVPQAHHANDDELALAVGHEYRHRMITRAHLTQKATLGGCLIRSSSSTIS